MEKRKWTSIKALEGEIIQFRSEGKTHREIADALGLERSQIRNWVKRNNRLKARAAAGILPKQRGRKSEVTIQEYKYENERLKMENSLLRDFLRLAGRK